MLTECIDENCNESEKWEEIDERTKSQKQATDSSQGSKQRYDDCEVPCRAELLPQSEKCNVMEGAAADQCREKMRQFYEKCVTAHCKPSKNEL